MLSMAMMMKMLKVIVTFAEAHMDHVSVLMLCMKGTVMPVTIMSDDGTDDEADFGMAILLSCGEIVRELC